jgi:murein L,D-transpeptidase YafK
MQTITEQMDASKTFCPNLECSARGKIGQGNIVIHGRQRSRYRCKTCKKTFSAQAGTMFEGLRKPVTLIMWREFPDHPAVNLQKRREISRFWSGFLRQPKHDSQHSRRIPTFRLKKGSCSLSVENLNRSQETKRKGSKEADLSHTLAFHHCRSTESDQDPQKSSNIRAIYHIGQMTFSGRVLSSDTSKKRVLCSSISLRIPWVIPSQMASDLRGERADGSSRQESTPCASDG